MKPSRASVFVLLAAASLSSACRNSGNPAGAAARPVSAGYHIGLVTGDAALSPAGFRGGEKLVLEYGSTADKGMIQHLVIQSEPATARASFIASAVSLADDPLMKAIIIAHAVSGTAEAVRQIKEKRPDLLVFIGAAREEPLAVQASGADLIVNGSVEPVPEANESGEAGDPGLPVYSYDFSITAGLGELARTVIEGKAHADSLADVIAAMERHTPGARWTVDHYKDPETGVRAKNQVVVSTDIIHGGGASPAGASVTGKP